MSTRKRITATIKMTFADDRDLIDWWQGIPLGQRNATLKEILRDHLAREGGDYRPRPVVAVPAREAALDPHLLTQLRDDAAWIRDALYDMPGYLEQLVTQVTATQSTMQSTMQTDMQSANGGAPICAPALDLPALNDAESQRRARKLKRATW